MPRLAISAHELQDLDRLELNQLFAANGFEMVPPSEEGAKFFLATETGLARGAALKTVAGETGLIYVFMQEEK